MSRGKIEKAVEIFEILKEEGEGVQFERLSEINFDTDLLAHLPEKTRDEILDLINKINHMVALVSLAHDDDKKKMNEELEEILQTLSDLNEIYTGLI